MNYSKLIGKMVKIKDKNNNEYCVRINSYFKPTSQRQGEERISIEVLPVVINTKDIKEIELVPDIKVLNAHDKKVLKDYGFPNLPKYPTRDELVDYGNEVDVECGHLGSDDTSSPEYLELLAIRNKILDAALSIGETFTSVDELLEEFDISEKKLFNILKDLDTKEYIKRKDISLINSDSAYDIAKALNRLEYYDWYCDECNDCLSDQKGFTADCKTWKCTKCGYTNTIDKEHIC